ncbi:MAG: DNA-3-methyladenine glycosylase I [Flavobacteriaceae bacterium]|nr:DNA-3-methyladenine glycosylase I [Flavobacteriaceae bacterium]MDG2276129.1 DNA-3-methyladenine glycosylase I [Flavobacteriaceae bacterium]
MAEYNSYCKYTRNLDEKNAHRIYHDTQYGFPIDSDNELFGRLLLEINQAGLSWNTVLNKQENFRKAYSNFTIKTIAKYDDKERTRLLNDADIIRNKLKIDAAIYNAVVIINIQNEVGSFKAWLNNHHPKTKNEWVKLFRKTFKFTGGEITNEFLMSTGYLKGSHDKSCPIYKDILKKNPKWNSN